MSSQVHVFIKQAMEAGLQRCLNSLSDLRANGQIPVTKSKKIMLYFSLFSS